MKNHQYVNVKLKEEGELENKLVVTSAEREGRRGKLGTGDLGIQTTRHKISK